jgi:hypothetical protein
MNIHHCPTLKEIAFLPLHLHPIKGAFLFVQNLSLGEGEIM